MRVRVGAVSAQATVEVRGYRSSRVTRSPSEQRIKTDRRGALMLARQSRAGDLTPIVGPDERDEATRDLSRAREDAIAVRLRIRQQMKAMLLRHGRDYVRYKS